jgi:hypothetical protein
MQDSFVIYWSYFELLRLWTEQLIGKMCKDAAVAYFKVLSIIYLEGMTE